MLGAKLTRNPTSSAARECLRMVVSDKSVVSDAVGAVAPWSQAVVPETLVADNGAAFKSEIFTNTCLDLQVAVLRTIAGVPGMRGTIERVFRTAGLDLMPRLKGRTFSNPQERGDYNARDRACLDAESVAFVLIRWIVDIYHNSPHEGLGGRTPLEQWEADMADGNYPLRALPDTRSKRLAFGNATRRKVSREGVVVMGIHYHSHALAPHFLESNSRQVDLRWDPDDLGAIDAFVGGEWIELDAVHDRFKGVNLQVWIKARKALRARSASRKTWNQDTVFRAIDEIEDLVQNGSVLFDVVDTSLSDTRIAQLEKDLYSSFVIGTAVTLHADGEQPGREIPARAPDPDTPRDARKARQKSTSGKAGKTTTPPHDDLGPDIPTLDSHKEQTRNAHAKPRMAWRPRKQDGADK
ncbi:Mu transposase C-terminal domain-containing protein [Roseovarius tibetensis]|uniref:Mu transposase C-terminal domain-containing protein n=1 Tax=Roseovarius tibetensis TaxID=2685897 RepID=UPI003D7F6B50